jgi:hypothetical protein
VILANAADRAIERGRLWVVIATIAINIIAVSLLALPRGLTGHGRGAQFNRQLFAGRFRDR